MRRHDPDEVPPHRPPCRPGSASRSHERLAELAARLAHGFYDRDEVRTEIVRRLLAREYPS